MLFPEASLLETNFMTHKMSIDGYGGNVYFWLNLASCRCRWALHRERVCLLPALVHCTVCSLRLVCLLLLSLSHRWFINDCFHFLGSGTQQSRFSPLTLPSYDLGLSFHLPIFKMCQASPGFRLNLLSIITNTIPCPVEKVLSSSEWAKNNGFVAAIGDMDHLCFPRKGVQSVFPFPNNTFSHRRKSVWPFTLSEQCHWIGLGTSQRMAFHLASILYLGLWDLLFIALPGFS